MCIFFVMVPKKKRSMGIKNLSKLLSRVAAAARRETQLSDYANQRFAIDVPIYMWKFCSVTCGHPLRCFEEQILEFGRHNIQPIYVFDGAAVACKQDEIARRKRSEGQHERRHDDGADRVSCHV